MKNQFLQEVGLAWTFSFAGANLNQFPEFSFLKIMAKIKLKHSMHESVVPLKMFSFNKYCVLLKRQLKYSLNNQHMAFTLSPSLSNSPMILNNNSIFAVRLKSIT